MLWLLYFLFPCLYGARLSMNLGQSDYRDGLALQVINVLQIYRSIIDLKFGKKWKSSESTYSFLRSNILGRAYTTSSNII